MTQLWTQLLICFFLSHLSKNKRQSIFISWHMKGNLCNLRRLRGINVTASSLAPAVSRSASIAAVPASHLSLPVVITPAFPPAEMKGQWQIYTRSAAEPRSPLKVRGSDPQASHWSVRACVHVCFSFTQELKF